MNNGPGNGRETGPGNNLERQEIHARALELLDELGATLEPARLARVLRAHTATPGRDLLSDLQQATAELPTPPRRREPLRPRRRRRYSDPTAAAATRPTHPTSTP